MQPRGPNMPTRRPNAQPRGSNIQPRSPNMQPKGPNIQPQCTPKPQLEEEEFLVGNAIKRFLEV